MLNKKVVVKLSNDLDSQEIFHDLNHVVVEDDNKVADDSDDNHHD